MESTKEIKKKRQKLTLYRKFYDQAKKQSDEDRLAIYDAILGYGFDNKKIDYDRLSNIAQVIVANMSIELNRMKNNFKNGCAEKLNYSTNAFGCRKNASQNEAKMKPNASPIYNNIYNNKNNYLNQPINLIKQTDENEILEISDNSQFFYECCIDQLKAVSEYASEHDMYEFSRLEQRMKDLLERVHAEKTTLKINKKEKTTSDIFERYLEIFRAFENDVIFRIQTLFARLDIELSKTGITNSYKYTVAFVYNHALDF